MTCPLRTAANTVALTTPAGASGRAMDKPAKPAGPVQSTSPSQTNGGEKPMDLTPYDLSEMIDYNPLTGELVWKPRLPAAFREGNAGREAVCAAWNSNYCGKLALNCAKSNGYRHGSINGKFFMAHRVAWAIYHGEWPNGQIDHINGIKSDNRISNLRDVSASQNMRNVSYKPRSKSGLYGVRFHRATGKWQAAFRVDGTVYSFGYHDTPEKASAVALAERQKFDFGENHGPRITRRSAKQRHANGVQAGRYRAVHMILGRCGVGDAPHA